MMVFWEDFGTMPDIVVLSALFTIRGGVLTSLWYGVNVILTTHTSHAHCLYDH